MIASVVTATLATSSIFDTPPDGAAVGRVMREAVLHTRVPAVAETLTSRADGWLGPLPRVTHDPAILPPYITRITWPYRWKDSVPRNSDPTSRRSVEGLLRDAVADGLTSLGQIRDVSVSPYVPAVHGSAAEWTTGTAAIAQSSTLVPTPITALTPADNPVGPSAVGNRPGTIGEQVHGAAEAAGSSAASGAITAALPWILAGGATAALIVVLVRSKTPPRRNPSRPKRKR